MHRGYSARRAGAVRPRPIPLRSRRPDYSNPTSTCPSVPSRINITRVTYIIRNVHYCDSILRNIQSRQCPVGYVTSIADENVWCERSL